MNVHLLNSVRPRDPDKQSIIRDKALEMFFEVGFGGFSMQKLAKAACVSPATLYIYFKDRDDLIIQLCREEIEKLNEAALEGFDPEMSFSEGLRIQWMNRARYFLNNPLSSHFLEQVRYTPFYYDEAIKKTDSNFIKSMQQFVKGAIQRNELIRLPVEVYWSVAFAPLYQLLKMDINKIGFPSMKRFSLDEKTILQTLDLVLKALTPANGNK